MNVLCWENIVKKQRNKKGLNEEKNCYNNSNARKKGQSLETKKRDHDWCVVLLISDYAEYTYTIKLYARYFIMI